MGLLILLKLMVKSFDVLAWPVITLIYPLCASIRAIESNETGDNRKWLTYWVLFALIMLFELTSAKLFEWIPFWPYMKLIAICWLVLPQFDGAAYVYERFIRPCFSLSPQTFSKWIQIPRMDNLLLDNSDDFLNVAERYIKENGIEELEKLIISKAKCTDTSHASTENNAETKEIIEAVPLEAKVTKTGHSSTKNNAVTEIIEAVALEAKVKETSHSSTENNAVTEIIEEAKVKETSHSSTENNAVTEIIEEVAIEDKCMETNHARTENNTMSEITEAATLEDKCMETSLAWTEDDAVTEITKAATLDAINLREPNLAQTDNITVITMESEAEVSVGSIGCELPGSSSPMKVQKEWTCALCQVTTGAEVVFQSHLQGKKHKNKVKELRENMMAAKNKAGADSKKSDQPTGAPKKAGVSSTRTNPKPFKKQEEKKAGVPKNVNQWSQNQKNNVVEKNQSALWCDTCKLLCNSTAMMISHLSGKKHLERCKKELFASSQTEIYEQG